MVILTASVGQRCAVLLPNNFFNAQATPSTGILIKRTLDREAIILIEEVWQFYGLETDDLNSKVTLTGAIRHSSWGWIEIPKITDKTMVIKVEPNLVKEAKPLVLESMIHSSVADFKRINRI
jgi:hypothetical protein